MWCNNPYNKVLSFSILLSSQRVICVKSLLDVITFQLFYVSCIRSFLPTQFYCYSSLEFHSDIRCIFKIKR